MTIDLSQKGSQGIDASGPVSWSGPASSGAVVNADGSIVGGGPAGPDAGSVSLGGDDHSDGTSEHQAPEQWKPQDTPSTCTFTCHIPNYLMKRESGSKKAEYSRITTDEKGNRWRLIIYVNGNGKSSNNHLSLFLQVADADELPFGWSKNVSYVLTLLHPSSPDLLVL